MILPRGLDAAGLLELGNLLAVRAVLVDETRDCAGPKILPINLVPEPPELLDVVEGADLDEGLLVPVGGCVFVWSDCQGSGRSRIENVTLTWITISQSQVATYAFSVMPFCHAS